MMRQAITRTVMALAVGGIALAQTASATVYVNKRYCGGDHFATCAAVILDVTGTTVTLRVWNLSGNTAGSYGNVTAANTVFNGIGLYNVPPGVDVIPASLSNTGPAKVGNSNPANWILSNNRQIGFLLDFAALPTQPLSGYRNGIASGCVPNAQLPNTPLYVNPCIDPSAGTLADWVTFTFQVNQSWDATNAYVMLRGKSLDAAAGSTECWTGPGPNGLAPTCFYVTPEPMTMTLLATGLVGLGGMGYLRRRKNRKNS